MRRGKASVNTAGLVVLGCLLMATLACGPKAPEKVEIGGHLPAFTLTGLNGQAISSESLKGGKPVILNFWATWCGPCRLEMPALQELHRGGGARVLSIAVDDDGAAVVQPFVQKQGLDYPVLIGDSATLQRYGGFALPYTLILDGDLRVHSIHRAVVSQRTLERDLAALGG